eukprot:Opistho-2@50717
MEEDRGNRTPPPGSPVLSLSQQRRRMQLNDDDEDGGGVRRMSIVEGEGEGSAPMRMSISMAATDTARVDTAGSEAGASSADVAMDPPLSANPRASAEWGDVNGFVNFFQHQTENISHFIAPLDERDKGASSDRDDRRSPSLEAPSTPSPAPHPKDTSTVGPNAHSAQSVESRGIRHQSSAYGPQAKDVEAAEWMRRQGYAPVSLGSSPPTYRSVPPGQSGYYTWHVGPPPPVLHVGGMQAALGVKLDHSSQDMHRAQVESHNAGAHFEAYDRRRTTSESSSGGADDQRSTGNNQQQLPQHPQQQSRTVGGLAAGVPTSLGFHGLSYEGGYAPARFGYGPDVRPIMAYGGWSHASPPDDGMYRARGGSGYGDGHAWPECSQYFPPPPSMEFPLRKTSSEPNIRGKSAGGNAAKAAGRQLKVLSGRDGHEPYSRARQRQQSTSTSEFGATGFHSATSTPVQSQPTTPRSAPTTPRYGQFRQHQLEEANHKFSHADDSQLWTSPSLPNLSTSPSGSTGILNAGPDQTGIVYDSVVLLHKCTCPRAAEVHGEVPERLQSVYMRLSERGLLQRCHRIKARKATLKELYAIHSEAHTVMYGTPSQSQAVKFVDKKVGAAKASAGSPSLVRLPCGGQGISTGLDSETYWNEEHSALAVRTAAGSVVELATKVARGELRNGVALVRPPGHHAERGRALGGCYINNVAVAAKALRKSAGVNRVMVVDWDLYHGNGTQEAFYKDPSVLFVSLHKSENVTVFPFTGRMAETGLGGGEGYTVNIPWSNCEDTLLGDSEYLAAFRSVVIPIARHFSPEIILVSAGFGAADGPERGGYSVSPAGFAHMTRMLMRICDGRVVLCLEGGASSPSLSACMDACVASLLGDPLPDLPPAANTKRPCDAAVRILADVSATHRRHWPILGTTGDMIARSPAEAVERERTEEAETLAATEALASLAMNMPPSAVAASPTSGHSTPVSVGVGMASSQQMQNSSGASCGGARDFANAHVMSGGPIQRNSNGGSAAQGIRGSPVKGLSSRSPRLTVDVGAGIAQSGVAMQSLAVAAALVDFSRE